MAYDETLAHRVREFLTQFTSIRVEEKKMFGGLAFMVHDKMCINVSGENLMCRFDPAETEKLSKKAGYQPMVMKGRTYTGYCYVAPAGFKSKKNFEFWVNLCLDYNQRAKSSKA